MSRPLRNWRCGEIYLASQRSGGTRPVFRNRTQYNQYIEQLFLLAKRYSIRVHAFCFMPHEVQLILEPTRTGGLSPLMRDLQSGHARRVGSDGHLWKHHYACKAIQTAEYRAAMRQVESAPVKAGIVKRAEDWQYSSARTHIDGPPAKQPYIGLYWKTWQEEFPAVDWKAWLQSPVKLPEATRLQWSGAPSPAESLADCR